MLIIKINKISIAVIAILFVASCTSMGTANQHQENISSINIHINQLAFEMVGPKSAIIASSVNIDLSEIYFTVTSQDNGKDVYQGKLEKLAAFNQWKSAYKQAQPSSYYRADFSSLKLVGNYQIRIKNQQQVIVSSNFKIAKQALFRQTAMALLEYFNGSRNDEDYNYQQDKHIRIFDTQRYVDVRGGYNDAGGDSGKYLSHLSYANYFNPQQLALVSWALAYSYQSLPDLYNQLGLSDSVVDEIFWGADYLHRILDQQGYFYMTVFDQWSTNNAERVITAYVGADGIYSEAYQSAFREGAGSAIAALARAYILAKKTNKHGEYKGEQYLADAEKAFRHLVNHNVSYCDDGKENIIDDYTALLAATELYRATENLYYLNAARTRANNLDQRLTPEGWFISNDIKSNNPRPFYHAAEAGFPIVSLSQYLEIETDKKLARRARQVIEKHLAYQLKLNTKVSNPFNYARQPFKIYKEGILDTQLQEGFFIPHANETTYWWQGESARLSSLAMAAIVGGKAVSGKQISAFGVVDELAIFAQNQMDWTLGRNPYNLSMLNGFGVNNPVPYEGLSMVRGGISNGITGAKTNDYGYGIEFGPETDWHNWRWVEQWLPHSTWFLLATTEMAK